MKSDNASQLRVENLTLDVPGRRLLDCISFELEPGNCLAVMGPSGSGKTSLLNCIGGITRLTADSVWVDGVELSSLRPSKRSGSGA